MRLPGSERHRKWALRLLVIAIVVAAYVAFTKLVDVEKLLEDVSNTLGSWTYLLVGFFAFAETGAFIGLIAPGETVMILGGAVAGQGAINLYLLIGIAWLMAWLGDSASFFIGRRLGREFLRRNGPRVGIGHERLDQVDDYFERHGGKTIFLGRFVGFVRAFAPFVAGSSGMRYRAFVPYSILGTGLWVSSAIVLGYFFSRSIGTVLDYAGKGAVALGTLIVVVAGFVVLVRHFRVVENRAAAGRWMEGHAATRWLVLLTRRFRPQLQFLWDRVTPGGTFGLEFTSLMATLAVALFVLIAYTVVVGGEPGPTPGDQTAADVVEGIRTGWLTDIAKAVTQLGSAAVVWSLALLCAALLGARRRWAELGVLLAGMAIAIAGAHELKAAVDRPRPEGGLVAVAGSSFPSAHAVYSTFYVWLAVTIVMRLRVGMARGAAVVIGGIALAALVGLSRGYLGVHYLSDVNAGWALGAASFAFCAAIALFISTVRQNGLDAPGPAEDRQ
ncbi:MAG TPA: bifunctional DedA family/phosphatase PAP2 family protein [Solirubrobacterales bacterium]|nr:bifunctional DedA family/phosphatase PAP2 family protein [Solirubrobacterales bacterium]